MRCVLLLCLAAGGLSAQLMRAPQVPRPVTGTGSIQGTVSTGGDGQPLRKAGVMLSGAISTPLRAVTDASGAFSFQALPAGNYWLNASKIGYQTRQDLFGSGSSVEVSLGDGEQRKDVHIELTAAGSISGRVVNEDGFPIRGCMIAALRPGYEQGRAMLQEMNGASSDDKGEYRIDNLTPDRYYLFARCMRLLPAAHPLLPHGDPRIPHETYQPQFYGGGVDPSSATAVKVAGGASMEGFDFRLSRVPAFTLRGSIDGATRAWGPINVMLLPANMSLRNVMITGASVNYARRTFEIQPVVPGTYRLFAFRRMDNRMMLGERMVQVSNTPPDPVEITLSGGQDLRGTVQFDSDDHAPLENCQVSLVPLEGYFFVPQPNARVDADGSFTLTGVQPGEWRLSVSTLGYPKSVVLGGQEVSPYGFHIAPGVGPLEIVIGSRMADVHVNVKGTGSGGRVYALIFPEDLSHLGAGQERVSAATGNDQFGFGALAPGHYRVFATDAPNPWAILQRPDLLRVLENRTAAVDVPEGGQATVTVEMIPHVELARIVAGSE